MCNNTLSVVILLIDLDSSETFWQITPPLLRVEGAGYKLIRYVSGHTKWVPTNQKRKELVSLLGSVELPCINWKLSTELRRRLWKKPDFSSGASCTRTAFELARYQGIYTK